MKNKEIRFSILNKKSPSLTDSYRYNFVFNYTALFGVFAHGFLIFFFFIIGVKEMALFNILSTLTWFILYRIDINNYPKASFTAGYLELTIHAILATYYLGWDSGYHYFLLSSVTVLFYMPHFSKLTKIFISVISTAIYISLYSLFININPIYTIDDRILHPIFYVNIIITFVMLSTLSYLYSIAAKKAEHKLKGLNKKLKTLASTDHLTDLINRRSMIKIIKKSILNYNKTGNIFSIIIADIDDFKKINDYYGHIQGDVVLKAIADLLKENIRKSDTIARWGGEEFLIILPKTNYREALLVAEKLKEKISNYHPDCLKPYETLTMTFGISQFDGDIDKCIKEADKALYKGKEQGKNCVIVFDEIT